MSQFIFDQVYGSEAKKKKIMENNNFIYYRQMMKIKNKHIKNKSLYQQLYQINNQTQNQSIVNSPLKLQPRQNPFFSINANNYTVQKINNHAFKIYKRKNKNKINFANNQIKIADWAAEKGYSLGSNRKLQSRTIDSDAKRLRNYLTSSESNSKKSNVRLKNTSLQLDSKSPRTPSKYSRNQCDTTAFSLINSSQFSFKKY